MKLVMEQLPIIIITILIILFGIVLVFYSGTVSDYIFPSDQQQVTDIKSIQESAKEFFVDYKGCLNSNPPEGESACLCYIGVKKYGTQYIFSYSDKEIRLYNDETNRDIVKDNFNGVVSCFVTIENNKPVVKEAPLDLIFKGPTKLRIKSKETNDYDLINPLDFKKPFYKVDNKLCFIIPSLLSIDINSFGLKECE